MKHSLTFRTGKSDNVPINALAARAEPCTSDTPYIAPAGRQEVDVNQPLTVTWNPNCAPDLPDSIELYLYAPTYTRGDSTIIFRWSRVNYWQGSLEVTINPALYNYIETLDMQFAIVDPSLPIMFTQIPAGPLFVAKYDSIAAASIAAESIAASGTPGADVAAPENVERFEVVDNFFKSTGMTKGQIAAAVIMPILTVAAFIIAYVIWTRKKEAAKRRQYREKVDQRMSIAPGADWAPISAAGAAAAIRHSIALSSADRNTRASSYFDNVPMPEMRQPRPRFTSTYSNTDRNSERMSRISFAPDTKNGDRPAVPAIPMNFQNKYATPDQTHLSPTQREGAFVLDDDSIRDRLSAGTPNNGRPSVDEELARDMNTLPAVAMMRADDQKHIMDEPPTPLNAALVRESGDQRVYSIGAYSGSTNSMIDGSTSPSYFSNAPSATADPDEALRAYATRNQTTQPFSGFNNTPLASAAGLDMSSPDAILRAYAATRPAAPAAVATTSTPSPMRALYNPTMTQGLGYGGDNTNNPYRDSTAPSSIYGGEEHVVGKAS